jgi:ABC-2 type transport system permease protein
MTTFPARALLGTVTWQAGIGCLVGAILISIAARLVWRLALRSYTSASS